MSTNSLPSPLPLPENPDLRHLKGQARDLRRSGDASSLAEAQFMIARRYGFASWPKLKAHLESLHEVGQLKLAIDANDLERVKTMMTRNPALHRAPLGYGKNGPLTWVAECRVPWEPPKPERLAMAQWMIENGSDIHQGGDGPLMRAALMGYRLPMMELLVDLGADVNAEWAGRFPILFAPCETVEPAPIRWLLEHGADPDCSQSKRDNWATGVDYVIGTYSRSLQLAECIDVLLEAGGTSRIKSVPVLTLLRGRLTELASMIEDEPGLLQRQFDDLEFGATGMRRLTLQGATLLHVAAEYGNVEAVTMLLERGADVNARARVDAQGVGGQTPLFHAVTQMWNFGLPVAQLLLERGADVRVRCRLPGHVDRLEEVVECTPLGYAERFPGGHMGMDNKCLGLLRERGATE